MPYTLKVQQIGVKNRATGTYTGVDVLSEQTEQGLINELLATGEEVKSDVNSTISAAQSSINTLNNQKDTIAQAVASMAELGTDTSLSTSGMAADAKATGEVKSALVSSVIPNEMRYENIKLNSTSRNRWLRQIAFKGGGNYSLRFKCTAKNYDSSNYISQIRFVSYKSNSTSGGTVVNDKIYTLTNKLDIDDTFTFDTTGYSYGILVITFWTQNYADVAKFTLSDLEISLDGVLISPVSDVPSTNDVATYSYNLIQTDPKVVSQSDFADTLNTIHNVGTIKKVSTSEELVNALTEADLLASETNWYNIYLSAGTYDLLPYIDLSKITTVTATGYRGIEVPRYTRLIGDDYRRAIIQVILDSSTTTTEQQWTVSPLNLKNDAELYGLTVIGKNCRYAVHDDGGNVSFLRKVRNCRFVHEQNESATVWSQQYAYGMGIYKGANIIFEDCDFESYGAGIYIHDNPNYNLETTVRINGCRFKGGSQHTYSARFHGLGASAPTNVKVLNCSFNKTVYVENTTPESMVVGVYNSTENDA